MIKKEKNFRKEFEEFAQKIKEEDNPIFQGESIEFSDFDNLINFKKDNDNFNNLIDDDSPSFNNDEVNTNLSSKKLNHFAENLLNYPKIDLETEEIKMSLVIKKDYSYIKNLYDRKKEFIKDLKNFIDEFNSTEESDELMEFYD